MMEWKFPVAVAASFAVLAAFSTLAFDCEPNDVVEWQILTKQNFSSEIRLHPHILLFVSVPWSGELRSLMKEVAHLVSNRQEEFSPLKLMLINRNMEKMLADAIGATTDEITILYYHHSQSYRYQGRYQAQNILSSIHPYMSLLPEEPPLTTLNNPEDLKTFLSSTDKALLVLEFCGWTPKLLANERKNGTQSDISVQGDLHGMSFNGETDRSPSLTGKNNQKVAGDDNWKCGVENGFSGVPWLGEVGSLNGGVTFQEIENVSSNVASSCTFQEFQQFDIVFTKFMTMAREYFLPPERHRFGLVFEKSMLSALGLEDSDSWLAMLYVAGCPSCSKILKKEDDLQNALQMDNSAVMELAGDKHSVEPSLPANKPSIVLFVDRSSDLPETRGNSKEALDAFRELALHYHTSNQIGELRNKPERSSFQYHKASDIKFKHPRLKLSPTAQKIKLKEKLSTIMIINDDKHVTLDKVASNLEDSSLHKILAHLFRKNEEGTLHSLAKELGFQLLSDDIDVKSASNLPSQGVQSSHGPPLPKEGLVSNTASVDKDQSLESDSSSVHMHEENSILTNDEPPQYSQEKTDFADKNEDIISVGSHKSVTALEEVATAEELMVEEKSSEDVVVEEIRSEYVAAPGRISSQLDNLVGEQFDFQGLEGSFFFSDGNYRLLRALTGGSKIPALVIVDPVSQLHYVLPQESNFSYSSLVDFVNGFVNGSLLPYQWSEPAPQTPREAARPPIVNVDFHEVDSIPRVTTRTFSKLVLGFNQSDPKNEVHAWNKDVLVLFSNSWCGFCQRMELTVREVYRALKGNVKALQGGSRDGEKKIRVADNLKDGMVKVPLIYLMDCTLNDCSSILKSIDQMRGVDDKEFLTCFLLLVLGEVYPALLLFPAERKDAVLYDGDMAVADIIKFISNHGSHSHHLIKDIGIPLTVAEKGGWRQNLYKDASPSEVHNQIPAAEEKFDEIIIKDRTPERVVKVNRMKSDTLGDLHEPAPHVLAGSVLVATEKLRNVQPFDKSLVLIVKADRITGFQGLIINKHIGWDSLRGLEEGLEMLKQAPLSYGGPLVAEGKPLVALTRRATKHQYPEVLPGVYFVDQVATIREIEEFRSDNRSIAHYWFFLGYSGWGWQQLFDEIEEGAWELSDDALGNLDWPRS